MPDKAKISKIASNIYDTCYYIEKEIVGHEDVTAREWASSNSLRHAYVVSEILAYYESNNKDSLKILNASGLSSGHQDFSIIGYLLKNEIEISWTTYESPRSPYLENELFKSLTDQYKIKIKLVDFNAKDTCSDSHRYDIIIVSEIAEHLEYGTFLRLLSSLRELLSANGILLITTPNLGYVANRYKFLFGKFDPGYWGDGSQNLSNGLWGHITYYDMHRLKRILCDVGLASVKGYTFNYSADRQKSQLKNLMINISTKLITHSAQNLLTISKRSVPRPIQYSL